MIISNDVWRARCEPRLGCPPHFDATDAAAKQEVRLGIREDIRAERNQPFLTGVAQILVNAKDFFQ